MKGHNDECVIHTMVHLMVFWLNNHLTEFWVPLKAHLGIWFLLYSVYDKSNVCIRGGSRVSKEGGHLSEKQLKTNKTC